MFKTNKIIPILAIFMSINIFSFNVSVFAEEISVYKDDSSTLNTIADIDKNFDIPASSGILIEQSSGQVLYEKNPDQKMSPASITKVMTLLLAMESLKSGKISEDDMIKTSEYASSMGGSQIWLEVGEEMSFHDILKATVISSANDAAVALAEHISGNEEEFVSMMNIRAKELGMINTQFKNVTGLDEEGHYSTARDISIMSSELIKYEEIQVYTTRWMDSLRGGEISLVNTNKLVRYYEGITGLKTGTTNDAGSCLTATAMRENFGLVAVVLGSTTSKERFYSASRLLDYGFNNYEIYNLDDLDDLKDIEVPNGIKNTIHPSLDIYKGIVVKKGTKHLIEKRFDIQNSIMAPVEKGQKVGVLEFYLEDKKIGYVDIKVNEKVDKINISTSFWNMIKYIFSI
ncbi:MAG: D-alanyl-D-alanine carboxypeptidase [Oscillospiraceae bacterium]|nr:D-alanyl-D-alanine carboxypeptidase [Oscillospiraceae bacterium]